MARAETRRIRPASGLLAGVALGAGAVAITTLAGYKDLNSAGSAEPARYVVAGALSAAPMRIRMEAARMDGTR